MKILGKLSIFPKLPEPINRLNELAYNLWWSWEPDAQALYAQLDASLWEEVNHNPVKFLRSVQQTDLDGAAQDAGYLERYAAVMAQFDDYMNSSQETWFHKNHGDNQEQIIAYFSAEFGLHESLPIYSGGLGILSGDHCKAVSDLGLPFIGIGFLYPQGYFTQNIDSEGRQQAAYEKIDFDAVSAKPALDPAGQEILIHVDLPGRTVYAKIWHIQVGRIPIYLMDTDVERNAPQDRELSARLYGGDREMRISQEVVLGIGGVRALRALGLDPAVWHMNEGHSAFLGLERVRELVQGERLTFDEAVEVVRANSLFTTHTPVPAGNDAFAFEMVEKFFWQYWGQLGLDRDSFINFASQELEWGPQYSMTVLALRLSAYHNGVSELHGHVSRDMWAFLWPDTPKEQVPIDHVTNGVHVKTWLAPNLRNLYTTHLGEWLETLEKPETWVNIDKIPHGQLWGVHQQCKAEMIELMRERVAQQFIRHGEGPQRIQSAATLLNPDALTIGFARRFATYKRATLIFHDEERLQRLLNDPERPVQIIFSGKAHPADEPGKGLIQHIYQLSQRPEYWGKILFVENYDMNIARHLVSGVDIWLNTPRRPHEASGTSGQKAALNGVPNFSVLDGWWVEGYTDDKYDCNGWSIGQDQEYKDEHTQDVADVLDFYTKLENEIIPLYFERDTKGVPVGWVQRMKNSIRTCAPRFSMRRMIQDYTHQFYLPSMASGQRYNGDSFALSRQMSAWKTELAQRWPSLHMEAVAPEGWQMTVGETLPLTAKVWANGVNPAEIVVEIVAGAANGSDEFAVETVVPMQASGEQNGALLYSGELPIEQSGQLALAVRARPKNEALIHPYEMGLNRWA